VLVASHNLLLFFLVLESGMTLPSAFETFANRLPPSDLKSGKTSPNALEALAIVDSIAPPNQSSIADEPPDEPPDQRMCSSSLCELWKLWNTN
jgi:hypothetical protein